MSIIPSQTKVYSGFDPRTIPGCQLWLDAADRSTITSTTYITGMTNKANTSQVFSANGTGLTFSTINGVQSINFPGTGSSYLYYASSTSLTSGTSFIMFSNVSTNPQYTPFYIWKGTTYTTGLGWTSTTTIGPYVQNVGNQTPSISVSTNTQYIVAHDWTSGSSTNLALNGTTYTSGTIRTLDTSLTPCLLQIGADYGTNLKANVGEIIIFNTILTNYQRQQVEGYLAWKWGLKSNLPATHPFKLTPILTRPFQPTDILNCKLWLDAADSSSITLSGSNVTQWNDKSGNANHATTSSNYPTYSINSLNNSNTVRFNGSSGTPNYIDIPAFDFGTSNRSAFFIIQNTGPSTGDGSAPHWFWPKLGNGTNSLSIVGWISTNNQGSAGHITATPSKNQYLLVSYQFGITSGFEELFINSSSVGTFTKSLNGTSYANASSGYRLGWLTGDTTAQWSFDGNIAEVILFNTTLTTIQRQQIESYLANKWGLKSNLPSTHPFKLVPAITLPFNPLYISNCNLWLDAADSSSITLSGSNVTQWNDKSGNGLILAQGASAPTLGPLLNNSQTIQFTTTQSLISTTNLSTNPAQTWFFVFNAYNNTNTNRFFLNHSNNIGVSGGEYLFGGNGTLWANIKSGNLSQQRAIIDNVGLGTTPFNSGQWYMTNIMDANTTTDITSFSFRIDGTNRSISINQTNNFILSGTASVKLYINNSLGSNFYVSEIIFYNSALTTPQIQQVEGYLAKKWGLQGNLPSTHPFKKITP